MTSSSDDHEQEHEHDYEEATAVSRGLRRTSEIRASNLGEERFDKGPVSDQYL